MDLKQAKAFLTSLREEGAVGCEPVGRSVYGTNRTNRACLAMSADRGRPEMTGGRQTGAIDPKTDTPCSEDVRPDRRDGSVERHKPKAPAPRRKRAKAYPIVR